MEQLLPLMQGWTIPFLVPILIVLWTAWFLQRRNTERNVRREMLHSQIGEPIALDAPLMCADLQADSVQKAMRVREQTMEAMKRKKDRHAGDARQDPSLPPGQRFTRK